MNRRPYHIVHLVEADHPALPTPEGDTALEMLERGGDLSALACAAMLDAQPASPGAHVHAVVALGAAPVARRAAALGANPVARVPVPFGTPHATANVLRKVIQHTGVRFDACIAWSAFAARVARLTGFGPGRGDLAPLIEADPHRPDTEGGGLERPNRQREGADLTPMAEQALRAAIAPARLPVACEPRSTIGEPMHVALLADPAPSGTANLAWRGSALAAAASSPIVLRLPAGCAGARRVGRLPAADTLSIVVDAAPLPHRLSSAKAALAVFGPRPYQHASPGLVAYALALGLPVVADLRRLAGGHPAFASGVPEGLHPVHACAPIEMARALLAALDKQPRAGTHGQPVTLC
ncbi:MAG: hypothetical protein KIT54_00425 [Phycisphaeraceae bacterium]|nr:hypothetical protein [Phycisphaeraceae bacterium]